MRLTELEPQFVRYETRIATRTRVLGDPATYKSGDPTEEITGPEQWTIRVATFAEAQGVMFLCPVCFTKNAGPKGTHLVDVTFEDRGATPEQGSQGTNGPTRWTVSGDSFENLTTSPSILLIGGCAWHGFITNGEIT